MVLYILLYLFMESKVAAEIKQTIVVMFLPMEAVSLVYY